MASIQGEQRVSAADFIRGFAAWRLHAARKPVVVTHHGKDAHVLLSLDEYRRLDRGAPPVDTVQASLRAVVDAVRDGVVVIDRDWRIVTINAAASDLLEKPAALLYGLPVVDAVPGLHGHLLLSHIGRMVDHRERFSGDIPGILHPRQWLHVDLVPLPVGGALILRDISAAMTEAAEDSNRQAFVGAVEAHGGIGRALISVRETVEDANATLTEMIGVDAAAIRRVRFSAMLTVGDRQAFVAALEGVFLSGKPARISSTLVTREGAAVPVILSIAERRGAYASDGALIVVTRI